MFSGIISQMAKITATKMKNGSLYLTIQTPKSWKIKAGDSICTNGTCLTVKTLTENNYTTELMPETLVKTYFEGMKIGDYVNLEKSLTPTSLMDGHIVTGHVDCVASITSITPQGDSKIYKYTFDKKFSKYVAEKASITVDGISLTVVEVGEDWFTTAFVDYTLTHTTIGKKQISNLVHLEFDIIAKYLEKLIK